jgi:hypothetical protein
MNTRNDLCSYLGCHTEISALLIRHLRPLNSGQVEVGHFDVSVVVDEQDILRLQIPMQHRP